MTPPKGARMVKEAILHARTVEVAASGHALMTEQPDTVLDVLYGFATEL
jgi:pimeloyl-ACP methyl ester carboxylesterase